MTKPTAIDEFMRRKAEIDAIIAELTELSNNHFNANPDALTWADAGQMGYVRQCLADCRDFCQRSH